MKLRPHQEEAVSNVMKWVKGSVDPCVIQAVTAFGKSYVVADLAHKINAISGKKILCTAPSGELVEQNYEKYLLTGNPASIYSASLGRKEMRQDVVFGTPKTIANSLRKFAGDYAAIIIDESHGLSPTLISIIDFMRSQNKMLRIIGCTGTPYRLGQGYIFQNHYVHGRIPDNESVDPFFHTCVYESNPPQMILDGYLTQPVFDLEHESYDTSGLIMKGNGKWDQKTIDHAFIGHGRKTANIVADVVEKSRNRKGVMFFAASIPHGKEIMASLPPEISAIITNETKKADRRKIIEQFKAKRIKYLVNVAVLTTGFDSPHVDVIAILRATESVALLQQIVGRGLRVAEGKDDCLVLDYAGNIERHCPVGFFEPEIKARIATGESELMPAICESCGHENKFSPRKNEMGLDIDENGYFVDVEGNRIEVEEGLFMPAHFGRRCQGERLVAGKHVQCNQKWSFKECPECSHENDIAARYCKSCRAELVDPNEKLKELAAKVENDPYRIKTADVVSMKLRQWPGSNGKKDTLRVDYEISVPPYMVSEWYAPSSVSDYMIKRWIKFSNRIFGEEYKSVEDAISHRSDAVKPDGIAYRLKKGTRFFEVIGYE